MILEQVELTNFRCFTSERIALDPMLNVFVAGNGAGKTTVLEGIALALAPIVSRLAVGTKAGGRVPAMTSANIRRTGEDQVAPFFSVSAVGRVEGRPIAWDRTKYRDASPASRTGVPSPRREIKELNQYVDRITDDHNADPPRPYTLPVFAFYGTNRAVDVPHYRLRKATQPDRFRRLAGLEGSLEVRTDFRRAVSWFDAMEQRELRAQRDHATGATLPELDAVRAAITLVLPEVSNPRIDGETGRFAVDVPDPSGLRVRLHLDQLSDGYQVVLGVAMDFAMRLALANPPTAGGQAVLAAEAILIIDEVDLHLHPSWQQRILLDLRRAFPRTQMIVSTHSPQVTTTVPSDNLRVISRAHVHEAPPGTDGAEAQRLLEDVFRVPARPPRVPMAEHLTEYLRLVDARQWDSPRARELRRELDRWSQGTEPRLAEADLRIANLEWEAGA